MEKYEVGQTVWLEPVEFTYKGRDIVETTISKIGRKYLSVEYKFYGSELAFCIEPILGNGCNAYLIEKNSVHQNWRLYFDKQGLLDRREETSLRKEIAAFWYNDRHKKLSLEQLRELAAILERFEKSNSEEQN